MMWKVESRGSATGALPPRWRVNSVTGLAFDSELIGETAAAEDPFKPVLTGEGFPQARGGVEENG
jgi:hypothetical protein